MFSKLTSVYPAPFPGRDSVMRGVFMGVFVGVFLFYFRPFGLSGEPYRSRPELLAVFGLLTLLASLILETIIPWIFARFFQDKHWRVWHQILFYLLLLLLIATLNGLFINYTFRLEFSWRNYGLIIGQTVSLGILPVTMIVLYRYNAKMAYNLEEALKINATSQDRIDNEGDRPSAAVSGSDDVLLAAEAFGNYVKLHYLTSNGWRQEVERTTLQKLVESEAGDQLTRCHRSYAVATDAVRRVSGNAQGLKLAVGDGALEIPVSRTYLPAVKKALEQ